MSQTVVATASSVERDGGVVLATKLSEGLNGASPKLVLVFASVAHDLAAIQRHIGETFDDAKVLGCTTSGEFTEGGDTKGAVAAVAISGDFEIHAGIANKLKEDAGRCLDAALDGVPREVDGYPHCTALLLLDPLSGNGEEATLLAAERLGFTIPLAGGAAGDDLTFTQTLVGVDGDVHEDAVVIGLIYSKERLGVGICHGHRPLKGKSGRVTRASGNTVHEIDGKPAWDVWKDNTRAAASAAGINVDALTTPDEIGAYLLRYEAGLSVGGGDYKIRAPLMKTEDGAISFACAIPEGTEFEFTESEPQRQVDAAVQAAKRARTQLDGASVAGAIVFDCICRNLILGDRFGSAVEGMSSALGGAPLAGFETYGEIALHVGEMSGFHNTTTVVLAFPSGN